MKRYTCELCNGNQFAKSENFFVCQQCGIKYGVDEMKKLLSVSSDDSETPVESFKNEAESSLPEKPRVESTSEYSETVRATPAVKHINEELDESAKRNNSARGESSAFKPAVQETRAPAKTVNNKVNAANNKSALSKIKPYLKKIKVKHVILGALALFAVVFFIVGLVKATDTSNSVGNNMLIMSGIAELLLAIILYKIMIHMERYNCPKCAAKRVHHRRYVRTSEVDKDFNNQGGRTYKTIYTHHYVDTYVCPSCGETRTERITKSGGEYTELGNGTIKDTRKPPREF